MINLAHLPEQVEKPNLCYVEMEGLRVAKVNYDYGFDMREGMNANGLLNEIMLTK